MSDGGHIWTYAVDPGTGALTGVSDSGPSSDGSIVVDSTGRFLYRQTHNGDFYAFAINPATGDLTLLPGSPFPALGGGGNNGKPLIVVKPRTPNPPPAVPCHLPHRMRQDGTTQP